MGFKKLTDYDKERYDKFFILRNDGDSARVVFLYESIDDVLVADAHYIQSAEYKGYIHCCGRGCPACAKGLDHRKRLFIPLYNYDTQKIEFFDRGVSFEQQLNEQVFKRFPNPSNYVFTITRHGAARDVNTSYDITVAGKNNTPIETILAKENTKFPDVYDKVIKEFSAREVSTMINNNQSSSGSFSDSSDLPDYSVTPRATSNAPVVSPSDYRGPNGEGFTNEPPGFEDELPEFEMPAMSADISVEASIDSDIDDVDF